MNIHTIEQLTAEYAAAHRALAGFATELDDELQHIKRQRRERLNALISQAADAKLKLKAAIEQAPALFDKPRTRILHDIKVGFRKGKGRLKWQSAVGVINKIKQLFDDECGVLIKTEEKPNKDALEKLPTAELKRLGITIEGAGDQVVIRPVEGDIDKLVDALLVDELGEGE